MGKILEWQLGFNIWPTAASMNRTASGVSPIMLLSLIDGANAVTPSLMFYVSLAFEVLF
jgi:hypothetical protein